MLRRFLSFLRGINHNFKLTQVGFDLDVTGKMVDV